MTVVTSRLVVSVSVLSEDAPESLASGAGFVEALNARGVPVTHLLRPRTAGGPLREGSPLVQWIYGCRAAGDTIALHGYDHTSDPIGNGHSTAPARVGRRAEFATLPRHEAGLRITAARRALSAVGLRTDVFVPPRWLASAGTVEALVEQGFGVIADENTVRLLNGPHSGTVVRAKVLGFRASGERRPVADGSRAAETWRCRVLLAEVNRTTRRGGLVRINVRAKDLRRDGRRSTALAAVDAALALGAVPDTYRQPVAAAA